MKLIKLQVENYKCIENTGEFFADQITCLMGKNEAGKTAILEALYKLNPVEQDKADFDELEFPRRHLATFRERQKKDPANVLTATWLLDDLEMTSISSSIGQGIMESSEVIVKKGYDNFLYWEYSLDEKSYIINYINDRKLNAAEMAQVQQPDTIEGLFQKLKSLDNPPEKLSKLLTELKSDFPDESLRDKVDEIITNLLPKFVYFDFYHKLPGRIALTAMKERKNNNTLSFPDKIFLALLEMTSSSLDDVEQIGESERLIMELEAIENSLTDQIFEYWSQNKYLEVSFRFDHSQPQDPPPFNQGWLFNTRIKNTRHHATVNFDERSSGFTWFFSFLIWFSQLKKNYGKKLFILLDEPGLTLHGKAQQDLLRYFNEKLRPTYQVIYSAHSPFMIDLDHIFSLRTVEDKLVTEKKKDVEIEHVIGTVVGDSIFSKDPDTLFPLQGIIGFDIAQTMFVGPNVIVVEGPSEAAYFRWFSRELQRKDMTPLDIRWAICPAEGASKIGSFVSLFSGRGLNIAALLDYHNGQKAMVNRLADSGLLPSGHLLKTSDFVSNEESDIEDIIGREMYISLVNEVLKLPSHLSMPKTKPKEAADRVIKEVEDHCRMLPPGFPEFNHYIVANFLITMAEDEIDKIPGINEAMERFSQLFNTINSL